MHVAIIGGASTIGSTFAYTIIANNPNADVTIVEKAEDAAWGHATDITHGQYHFADSPKEGSSASGTIESIGTDELETLEPNVVVITARAPLEIDPKEAENGDVRKKELAGNVPIIDDIATQLRSIGPLPVIVVTNPIDTITYRLWDRLKWDRERFLGFSLAETARAAETIASLYDVHPSKVYCPTMGEHGDNVVPIFSKATVNGDRVSLSGEQRAEITERVLEIPFKIAEGRGIEDSSRWVTSAGLSRVLRNMFDETLQDHLCLSVPVDGEYGLEDGCLSIPVELNESGVKRTIEWDLSSSEAQRVETAHNNIQTDINRLDTFN
ncbi:malate dehydrogenase [Halostagnicola bangensis]